jgi:voltage-dependent calcium channel L type alpha-1D
MATESIMLLRKVLHPSQGLVMKSDGDSLVKVWQQRSTLCYRVLTPSEEDKSSFDQGELVSHPFSEIETITPSGETAPFKLVLKMKKGEELVLETDDFEELSFLSVGFQCLKLEPVGRSPVVGGAPGDSVDDADEGGGTGDEIVVLPPPVNPGRLICWQIVTFPAFDNVILVSIAINCFFMAIEDPVKSGHDDEHGRIMYFDFSYEYARVIGRLLLWVFTVESLLKNVAYTPWGYFFGPDANWNRLDFFIVVVGWLEEYPEYLGSMPFNLSFLRIFRVFRPLRTLGKMDGMKELINTMFLCVDPLVDVLNLTIFVFFVFSVLGMELFSGQGSQRCIDPSNFNEAKQSGNWSVLSDDYTFPLEERRCGGDFSCPMYEGVQYKCYHVGRNPAEGIVKQNQADGIIGYDNIGQAMLTVFVFCTLEGWVDGMYQFQDSFGWAVSALFHTFMILLGTFFCMNLALAVIADTFEDESGDDDDEEEEEDGGNDGVPMLEGIVKKDSGSSIEEGENIINANGDLVTPRPADKFSSFLYDCAYHPIFSNSIVALIIFNTATLAMEHANVSCLEVVDITAGPNSAQFGYFAGEEPECITQADVMSDSMDEFLHVSNLFFVVAFALEAVVKLIGLRPKYYFKDSFNCFDFLIVIVSFIETSFKLKGMTALRCFRLARLFKMARSWGSLKAIIKSLLDVLPSMTSLSIMLFLYMFIAAVAGMQMLGNYIPYSERSRFTDFGIAMLTIFQMLTGENWNEVMFSSITSTGNYFIVVYFILVVIIGNFLVLNLFLAIMLSDFSCGEPPDFSLNNFVNTFMPFVNKMDSCPCSKKSGDGDSKEGEPAIKKANSREEEKDGVVEPSPDETFFTQAQLSRMNHSEDDVRALRTRVRSQSAQRKVELEQQGKMGSIGMVAIRNDLKIQKAEAKIALRNKLHGVSLGYFPEDSVFRRKCMKIVRHPYFESFILFCIIFSSILLACDGPTNDSSTIVWRVMAYLDFSFIIIFTIECSLKIVVQGFYFCPEGYLKDPWNILDFVVVLVGWVSSDYKFLSSPLAGEGVSALRTLRSLRALRPLRTIQRLPGMRLVVAVLFECTPVFINICFVVFFFFTVFAIMGVQFFAGRFWSCNDGSVNRVDQCWGCFEDEEGINPSDLCPDGYSQRKWSNAKMNFDNTANALLTLYEVAGLEMWLDVMYAAMDTRPGFTRNVHGSKEFPFGAQPIQESNWPAAFYFIVFILIGVFIVLNLFVGAVVDKFNELKESNGGVNPLQTEEQSQYTESMALMSRMRPFRVPLPPRRPHKKAQCHALSEPFYQMRLTAYHIVMFDTSGKAMGTTFDMFISFLVMINILVMGMYYWRRIPEGYAFRVDGEEVSDYENTGYYRGLELINNIFTFIFLIEMCLKLAAWGMRQYLQDMWNQLDFVLVISSVTGFFVELLLTSGAFPLNPAVFRILRVARLTRALKSIRMVGRIKGIARLVDTLVVAIPAMMNVASLCFLVIFIFTVMGMDFFGKDDIDQEYINGMYNRHANFRYFGDGFMLLFRAVTGEAWNGVMHDIMVAECDQQLNPLKETDKDYDKNFCGAPHTQAWIFFVIFMVFVTGLLFELITAIVLDEFGKMNESEKLPVNGDMISNFNDHWAQLDPKATQMIPQHKLLPFLKSVDPPIFKGDKTAGSEIFHMNIASTQGPSGLMVHYVDTLVAVVRYMYVRKLGEEVGADIDVTMIESPELTARIVSAYPHLKKIEKLEPKDFKTELAATKLQNLFLRKRAAAKARAKRQQMEIELSKLRGSSTEEIDPSIKSLSSSKLVNELRKENPKYVVEE